MTDLDPIDVHVGHRLRAIRMSRQMSMLTLGKSVCITYQQIQKYEFGKNRIAASTLWRIAGVLDVGVDHFFDGLDDPPGALTPDADTIRAAAAIGRMEPKVGEKIRKLIDALAAMEGADRV